MTPAWHEEAITRKHDRTQFNCGDPILNTFLARYARQSHDQGAAKTFLAIETSTSAIIGFYSLAPASLSWHRAPETTQRGLARHEIPGFRLARLAVHHANQGQGLGGQLLLAAGRRCIQAATAIGGTILIIDAKSERAAAWYTSYGATALPDTPQTLVLPLATIENLLKPLGKLPT